MITLAKKITDKLIFQFPENIRVLKTYKKISKLKSNVSGSTCDVIVFSKDRPLQLKALIESYLYYCDKPAKISIIYNTSSTEFQKAYNDLFKEYEAYFNIVVDDSLGFKKVLLSVLESLKNEKLFFLVDDIIFKKKFSIAEYLKFDRKYIPSLRMGLHLKRSYTQGKAQKTPIFSTIESDVYSWSFSKAELDWGYPLSVDGHIFYRDEIILMTKALCFRAPNSYEEKLQKFNAIYKKRIGVCEELSVTLNIPCNKVQIENENIFGSFHQDDLLKLFPLKRIDFKSYENMRNESCHQEVVLSLVDR